MFAGFSNSFLVAAAAAALRPLSGPQREFCSRYPLAVSLASASRLLASQGIRGGAPD